MTLQLTARTQASVATPPASTIDVFADTADSNKPKYKDPSGVVHTFGTGGYSVYNPRDYGTIDPTGAADSTAAFTAAKTAMVAANVRAVYQIDPGVYLVDMGVITGLTTNPCVIQGWDRGTTVLIPRQATGNMIQCPNGGDGFTIQNLAIYQTGTPQTAGNGIDTNGCNDVLIRHVLFVNQFNDVNIQGSSIKVDVCHTVHSQSNGQATSVGILVNNGAAGDTYIGPDVVMSNTGATRRASSVTVTVSGHFEINQCNLTGSAQGLLVNPGAAQIVADGFINQSLFDSNTVNGVTLNATTATSTIKSIKFVNSWFSGTVTGAGQAGFLTTGTGAGVINGISFTTCRALNNQTHGWQHGFGTDFRWTDCDSKGNSAAGANANDGLNIAAAVSNWSVLGGKFGGTDGATTGGNQRWGINILAGASNNYSIIGADVLGNTTGGISDLGTGTAKTVGYNVGFKPQATSMAATSGAINTTDTQLVAYPVGLGAWVAGDLYAVELSGTCTSSAGNASTFTLRAGTGGVVGDAAIATVAITAAVTGTNIPFSVRILVRVPALGTTVTVVGVLSSTSQGLATGTSSGIQAFSVDTLALTGTNTLNTTTATFLGVSYKTAAATTTSTFLTASIMPVR